MRAAVGQREGSGPGLADDSRGPEEALDEPLDELDEPLDEPLDQADEGLDEPPPREGEAVVLREPGVLAGPYPSVDLVLVAGIEHVAAAWAHRPDGQPLDLNLEQNFDTWLRDRLKKRARPREETARQDTSRRKTRRPRIPPRTTHRKTMHRRTMRRRTTAQVNNREKDNPVRNGRGGGGRVLSPYAVPARLEQAGSRGREHVGTTRPATPASGPRCSPPTGHCSTSAAPNAWRPRRRRPPSWPGTAAA